MASIEPEETKLEVDSISLEQHPESPGSVSEKSSELIFIQNIQRKIPKPLCYPIYCLPFVCLAPVACAFSAVVIVASLPLLIVGFVLARSFQIIVRAENYVARFKIMVLLRFWLFAVVMLLLVEVGLFYPIAKYVPGVKFVLIIGLPITKWVNLICILIGIYLIGQCIWVTLFIITDVVVRLNPDEGGFIVMESVSEIADCLLAWWASDVVMSSVPTFKQSKIYGIYTQKWIKVSLFLLIGYNVITVLAHSFVWSLPKKFGDHPGISERHKTELSNRNNYNSWLLTIALRFWLRCVDLIDVLRMSAFNKKYVVYAIIGTKRSAVFILSMVMLLITWVLYFGNHLNTTLEDKKVLEFGTWTFVSLLICSFLWLIKSCILLYWEACSVYDRLHSKVTAIGKRLYFFILLSYKPPSNDTYYESSSDTDSEWASYTDCESSSSSYTDFESSSSSSSYTDCELSFSKTPIKEKLSCSDRKTLREKLIVGIDASTYEIQKAAEQFLTVQYALSKKGIDADVLKYLQGNDSKKINENCQKTLKQIVKGEAEFCFDDDWKKDWKMLLKLLPDVKTDKDITLEKVQIFMERARSSCMSLTNTFISEKEVVKCLNQVMSGIIIVAIFITWLLLTGLASTKVLVLIASPALAATFIFGDTAKGLFQGLIFVYVVHPFDVGDLCVIDGELLEVVRISVWCTTFSYIRTIGEHQQAIYPNSVLSQKNIVNHKSNFNWNDQVEFLCTPDKRITEQLRRKIDTYLKKQGKKFAPNFHSVEVREIGDKAKIVVHIKHKLPATESWTNFECLKEKEKRRYELAFHVHDVMKQLESSTETPESAGNGKNIELEDD